MTGFVVQGRKLISLYYLPWPHYHAVGLFVCVFCLCAPHDLVLPCVPLCMVAERAQHAATSENTCK